MGMFKSVSLWTWEDKCCLLAAIIAVGVLLANLTHSANAQSGGEPPPCDPSTNTIATNAWVLDYCITTSTNPYGLLTTIMCAEIGKEPEKPGFTAPQYVNGRAKRKITHTCPPTNYWEYMPIEGTPDTELTFLPPLPATVTNNANFTREAYVLVSVTPALPGCPDGTNGTFLASLGPVTWLVGCGTDYYETNCTNGSIDLGPDTNSPPETNLCIGVPASFTVTDTKTPSIVRITTHYTNACGNLDTNACPPTTVTNFSDPYIISRKWTWGSVTGNSLTASFTPTNGGSQTVEFEVVYSTTTPCATNTNAANFSIEFEVDTNCIVSHKITNCLSEGSVILTNLVFSNLFCLSNDVTASVTPSFIDSKLKITTFFTNSCGDATAYCPNTYETNNVTPEDIANGWYAQVDYSEGGFEQFGGDGLSASFTPTNSGSGFIKFFQEYVNGSPCSTNTNEVSTPLLFFTVTKSCHVSSNSYSCTNGSVELILDTNAANSTNLCMGDMVSITVMATNIPATVITTTHYTNSCGEVNTNYCSNTFVTNQVYPVPIGEPRWTAGTNSGTNWTASFHATNGGEHTIEFELDYTLSTACATNTNSATFSVNVNVSTNCLVKTTNFTCLSPGVITFTNASTNLNLVCVSNQITVGVTKLITNSLVRQTIKRTNDCGEVSAYCPDIVSTNSVPPTETSISWVAEIPGAYTNSGTGVEATFTPTAGGAGTITFYAVYVPESPCGTNTVTNSIPVDFSSVAIEIRKDGVLINSTNNIAIVGENIGLSGVVVPASVTVTNSTWTIPGKPIESWTANNTTATLQVFTNFSSPNITFFWPDTPTDLLQYEVGIQGLGSCVGEVSLEVKKPVATVTTTSGTVQVSSHWGSNELHCGTNGNPGVGFTAVLAYPTNSYGFTYTGTAQWVQKILSTDRRIEMLNSTNRVKLVASGDILDTSYPYPAQPSSSTNTFETSDSPGNPATANMRRSAADDSFEMYLMFQPTGGNWVPLKVTSWTWSGDASSTNGNNWNLDSFANPNPSTIDTTDHPTWNTNITSFQPVPY